MTLREFIKIGGCMLSNDCEALLCHDMKINGKILRDKELYDIFQSAYGNYARRQLTRYAKKSGMAFVL